MEPETHETLLVLGLLVSPGILLSTAFGFRRLLTRRSRAPIHLTILALLAGAGSVAILVGFHEPPSALDRLVFDEFKAGVTIPLMEEGIKALMILLLTRMRSVKDALDGLFVGAFVGLGFMVVENHLFFMIAPTFDILEAMYVGRTFAPVHVVAASWVGAAFGWQRSGVSPMKASLGVIGALLAAVAFHGLGNVYALGMPHPTFFIHIVITLVALSSTLFVIAKWTRATETR